MLGLNAQLLPLSEWLVRTTVQGTVVICLILLVKTVLRDKLPIRWHYWLWLLLLVRIFLPWAPSSQLSIFNFIPASLEVGGLAPFGKGAGFFRFVDILPYVWLIGALILSGYVLLRSFRLWRTVKRERPITDQKILDLLEDCKMQMSVQTILGVVVTDRVKSPALFGFIRPRLLLPEGMIERHQLEELRYIFIHELGHLKQRDIYLSWLMTLFQVVYWFNPLMWFAIRRIRLEREFACDGLALSNLRPDEPARYGHTIVNLLEKFSQVSYVPSVAGILEDTSQIERRIKMITKFKKTSRTRSVGAVLLVAILACVVLTDPYPAKADFTFGTPTNLGPIVNSTYMDCHPSISADGLSLYFTSDQPGGSGGRDLWLVTRATTEDDWNTPIWLGPTVNSSANDGAPCISADGLSLYFGSGRPGGYGGGDIWVTTRSTIHDDWGTPENLGWPVNISYEEVGPSISADGLTLFFFSMPSQRSIVPLKSFPRTFRPTGGRCSLPPGRGPVDSGATTYGRCRSFRNRSAVMTTIRIPWAT